MPEMQVFFKHLCSHLHANCLSYFFNTAQPFNRFIGSQKMALLTLGNKGLVQKCYMHYNMYVYNIL